MVAIDGPLSPGTVRELCEVASGVKVGLPPVLSMGVEWAIQVARQCAGLRILDFKLADIGPIMEKTVSHFLGSYDAFIAHSFIGVNGALDHLKKVLSKEGARLVLVASMSHPGSQDAYDPSLDRITRIIEEVDPWGLVAPATRPKVIRRLKSKFPEKVVLAPGVGAQGAAPGDALCSGADYEIVGRSVTMAPDPIRAAMEVVRRQNAEAERCRS